MTAEIPGDWDISWPTPLLLPGYMKTTRKVERGLVYRQSDQKDGGGGTCLQAVRPEGRGRGDLSTGSQTRRKGEGDLSTGSQTRRKGRGEVCRHTEQTRCKCIFWIVALFLVETSGKQDEFKNRKRGYQQ